MFIFLGNIEENKRGCFFIEVHDVLDCTLRNDLPISNLTACTYWEVIRGFKKLLARSLRTCLQRINLNVARAQHLAQFVHSCYLRNSATHAQVILRVTEKVKSFCCCCRGIPTFPPLPWIFPLGNPPGYFYT